MERIKMPSSQSWDTTAEASTAHPAEIGAEALTETEVPIGTAGKGGRAPAVWVAGMIMTMVIIW
jgi:hypothetical protein